MKQKKVENLLAIKNPTLAAQWHPTLNGDVTPYDVTCGLHYKAWWQCPKHEEHVWQANVGNRHKGAGCPHCAGYNPSNGIPITETHPEIAAEWHPTLNGDVKPEDVTYGSVKKVWWQCSENPEHIWEAAINSRTKGKSNCKECKHIKNTIAVKCPELVKEWHPFFNGEDTPANVSSSSKGVYWWVCEKGHDYQSTPLARKLGGTCPDCGKGKCGTIYNNLMLQEPEIAAEWHPTKNGALTPYHVRAGSERIVWWRCAKGHEWEEGIFQRVKRGTCSYCEGKKAAFDNNICVTHPEIAAEWHPTKNGHLKPENFVHQNRTRIWWKCANGHEWERTIVNRTNGNKPCPKCKKEASKSLKK